METNVIKEYKIKSLAHCIVGLIFLAVGFGVWLNYLKFVDSSKAKVFFGLAIVAAAMIISACIYFFVNKKY